MPTFRGDCHVHSRKSHAGELAPAEIVAEARAAGLDFLAVTEHDAAADLAEWTGMLIIPGQEVLTPRGHWLALGLPPGVVVREVEEARRLGAVCVAAHPFAPYPGGTLEHPLTDFDAVEVWNGRWRSDLPWNADNEAALALWRDHQHLPAIGNSDVHLPGQLGTPQLVIEAPSLTADAVLTAIRTGACHIAGSADIDLILTPDRVRVTGVPSGRVTVHTDRGPAHHETLPASGTGTVTWPVVPGSPVHLEIRHPDGRMAALTNRLSR
ncbi:MAG TPA: CehA/McbA family metallohydrolase [Actinoplanes sp.]|nr:CehA/McbA family metallohydrolase [Actinoplanes sp.]